MYSLLQNPAYQVLLFLLLTPILIAAIHPKTADRAYAERTQLIEIGKFRRECHGFSDNYLSAFCLVAGNAIAMDSDKVVLIASLNNLCSA